MDNDQSITSNTQAPPEPPSAPTAQDFETLRARVKAALGRHDISQRTAEEKANLSVGYLSKMFKGETRFTQAILIGLCRIAEEEPYVIVQGTPWEYMIHEAPPDQESERIRQLAQHVDELKVRLAETEAELLAVKKAREHDQAGRANAEQAEREARERAYNASQASETHRRAVEAKDREILEMKAAQERLTATLGERERQIEDLAARTTRAEAAARESRTLAEQWRASSQKHENNSAFLQRQVNELEGRYSTLYRQHQNLTQTNQGLAERNQALATRIEKSAGPGTGAVLGFAAGLLIAAGASPDGRRR